MLYRLFFLNAEGNFTRVLEIDVSGDETAMTRARALDHPHSVEVWQGKRKVGVVGPPY